MKTKLTPKVAQAFTSLRVSRDFAIILEWLSEHRTQYRDECCIAEGNKLYRSQGKAEAIDSILAGNKEAPEVMEKVRTQIRQR